MNNTYMFIFVNIRTINNINNKDNNSINNNYHIINSDMNNNIININY